MAERSRRQSLAQIIAVGFSQRFHPNSFTMNSHFWPGPIAVLMTAVPRRVGCGIAGRNPDRAGRPSGGEF